MFVVTKGVYNLDCKFQPLVFNTFRETEFSIFPHKNALRRKLDCAVKSSNVNLGSSFEQIWMTLSPQCSITRFSLEAFFVLEKKIVKCFSPHKGMSAILFNNAN